MTITLQMGSGIPGASKCFLQWVMAAELGSQSSASSLCCKAGGQRPSNIRQKCKTHLVFVCMKLLADKNDGEPCSSPPSCLCPSCLDLGEGRVLAGQQVHLAPGEARADAWCIWCTDVHGSMAGAHQAPLQHRDTVPKGDLQERWTGTCYQGL